MYTLADIYDYCFNFFLVSPFKLMNHESIAMKVLGIIWSLVTILVVMFFVSLAWLIWFFVFGGVFTAFQLLARLF